MRRRSSVFLDELTEGTLIHAKTVSPEETMSRNGSCYLGSKYSCALGIPCPDSTPFVDELHQHNLFQDESGNYCNCWVNQKVEQERIPRLERLLRGG